MTAAIASGRLDRVTWPVARAGEPDEPDHGSDPAAGKGPAPGQTFQERALWPHLRGLKAHGLHVRRQAPIVPYIADFALLSHRLVIEIDGDSHGAPGPSRHDAIRDQWLASQGFTVWRFSARDIEHNLEGVVETILLRLGLFGPETD
ncbi:endonuclease domain-containing protein [Pannonibacter tanglangensis]|nr:endonuclease domain-containing protein [Pannonibacter sp. XCT-53]